VKMLFVVFYNMKEKQLQLLSLQFLRGLAAIIVVFYHAHGLIIKRASELNATAPFWLSESAFTTIGAIGVDIFFLISGFIIFYTSRNNIDIWLYIKKRVLRIYPIWFVAIFAMLIISLLPGSIASVELRHLILSLLLIPHYFEDQFKPFLQVGWTLNFEIIFYLLFGLAIISAKNKKLEFITVLMCTIWFLAQILSQDTAIVQLLSNPVLFEFVIGGWLAKLFMDDFKINKFCAFFLCLFSLFWLCIYFYIPDFEKLSSFVSRGPLALAIFILMVFYEPISSWKTPNIWVYLGNASYSIYLFHMFPIMIMSGVLKRKYIPFLSSIPTAFFWLLITVISITFGCFVHSLIERKINKSLKGFIKS
jgi:exopolysaccharide production protein ExoZ